MNDLPHLIALNRIPGIGPVRSRLLLARFGNAEAIRKATPQALRGIPEIGPQTIDLLRKPWPLTEAEREVRFMESRDIYALVYGMPGYPHRLQHCDDAPFILYTRGNLNLNHTRIVSIVGTRAATPYGLHFCNELVDALSGYKPVVVSGLAFGIDVAAHRACVRLNVPTAACLAHGLDRVYPSQHAAVAREILDCGGLVTEFMSGTRPDRESFPMRNRIIAGLSDCTVVIETDLRGGSMITAHLAHSYGREVYALPGRTVDPHSLGCNQLIRRNIAALLSGPEDLADYLGWNDPSPRRAREPSLFEPLNPDEISLLDAFPDSSEAGIDALIEKTGLAAAAINSSLLSLEFKGAVMALPGKTFRKLVSAPYLQ